MESILKRRSIRKYTSTVVSEAMVRDLLRAAMSAPSAGNGQPWQFVVIRDRTLLDEVPKFHGDAGMIREASVAVLICGDLRNVEFEGRYWVQDCAAATENLLLAASALGLGAVWLGVHPLDERVEGLRRLLDLPKEIVPFALVPVGHPAEEKPPADRFDEARVHYDRW